MDTVSESVHSSLAERIAKVRDCMLVEVSTGISVTDKDLFVSLCQAYEQNRVEEPSTLALLPRKVSPYRATPLLYLMQEGMWRKLRENEQSKDAIYWRLRHSCTISGFPDSDWTDWDGQ